jgi:hypothetical protein
MYPPRIVGTNGIRNPTAPWNEWETLKTSDNGSSLKYFSKRACLNDTHNGWIGDALPPQLTPLGAPQPQPTEPANRCSEQCPFECLIVFDPRLWGI